MKEQNDKETEEKNEIIDIIPQEDNNSNQEKNEETKNEDENLPKKKLKDKLGGRLGKAILITAAIVLVIFIVVMIILHLSSSKGIRTAEKISRFLGETPKSCESKFDISLKTQSAYDVLNNGVEFDRIYEDNEKSVKCDGITFPSWAVFVSTGNGGNIDSVRYTDFNVIKDNLSGNKKNAPISLKRFEKGTSKGTIEDEIGLDPYSIIFRANGTKYVYKYWYKTDAGDKQSVILSVNYDKDSNFVDFESKLIYPANL